MLTPRWTILGRNQVSGAALAGAPVATNDSGPDRMWTALAFEPHPMCLEHEQFSRQAGARDGHGIVRGDCEYIDLRSSLSLYL